jgi:hypothetical protein
MNKNPEKAIRTSVSSLCVYIRPNPAKFQAEISLKPKRSTPKDGGEQVPDRLILYMWI